MHRPEAPRPVEPLAELRVCHLLHTLSAGGAQELLVHLAEAAPSAGIALSVVSLAPADGERVTGALRARAVPVHSLGLARHDDPRALPRATSAVRALGAQLVHTHGKRADLVGGAASLLLRRPQVSTLHLIEDGGTSRERLTVRAAALARAGIAARTLCVSEAQRSWYVGCVPRPAGQRVTTLHNGVPAAPSVPTQERARLRAEMGVGPDEVLVLSLGLLRPDRGHSVLLEAARSLPSAGVHVVVAGDGPLRDELEHQALGAPGAAVTLLGFRSDVPALLDAADVVVHPSLTDALPTALLHALAAGRPVVASGTGGIPEIVTTDVGLLVPPDDAPALAAALRRACSDEGWRLGAQSAARARHAEHFSALAWAGRLRALYDDVLADGPVQRSPAVGDA